MDNFSTIKQSFPISEGCCCSRNEFLYIRKAFLKIAKNKNAIKKKQQWHARLPACVGCFQKYLHPRK